jgi:hypothetical protein
MADFTNQLIVDIVDDRGVVQSNVPQDVEDENTVAQIQREVSSLSPTEVSEKLADRQKKNQLTAEMIVFDVDIPNTSKNLRDIDLELNKKQKELNRVNAVIDPLLAGISDNLVEIDIDMVIIIEKLNSMRKDLSFELNTLRITREKITDKYYKLRQSVKEPTININQFNMENASSLFDKFKIKKR